MSFLLLFTLTPHPGFQEHARACQEGIPQWCNGKESACQCRRLKRHGFDSWVRKIPWRRKWQPIPDSCLQNSRDRGVWRATVPGVTKSRTWLSVSTHAGCASSTSLVQERSGQCMSVNWLETRGQNVGTWECLSLLPEPRTTGSPWLFTEVSWYVFWRLADTCSPKKSESCLAFPSELSGRTSQETQRACSDGLLS